MAGKAEKDLSTRRATVAKSGIYWAVLINHSLPTIWCYSDALVAEVKPLGQTDLGEATVLVPRHRSPINSECDQLLRSAVACESVTRYSIGILFQDLR